MRRILVLLVIIAVAAAVLAALWIFRGRQISSFIDRYWTVEIQSAPIQSIAYEGSGTGGILICDSASFSLADVTPGLSLSLGSTKDNQLALASSGKVFPFGPLNGMDKLTSPVGPFTLLFPETIPVCEIGEPIASITAGFVCARASAIL